MNLHYGIRGEMCETDKVGLCFDKVGLLVDEPGLSMTVIRFLGKPTLSK